MSILKLFKIKKEERILAFFMLFVFAGFTTLLILSHFDTYTMGAKSGYWSLFTKNFRLSGYDNWSWITISGMRIHFETIRHPLFLSFLYPMYMLNHWLIETTGINFAVFFMATWTLLSAFYSVIFMYRINREVIELKRTDATLLTLLLFSFAHILIPTFAPDHFVVSLMLLLLSAYIFGIKIKKRLLLKPYQAGLLFFFTTGMASSNGAKILLGGLFTNGKRFFHLKYLIVGIALPAALLLGIQQWQYYALEVPQKAVINKIIEKKKGKEAKKFEKFKKERDQWLNAHTGKNPNESAIGKLMDVSTPRSTTLVENFFGESIQTHQYHLMKDVSWDRPIFVPYAWSLNYIVEALIVLLFIFSLFIGIKKRFLQMLLAWFSVDIILHLVLGFAINEVYIMTSGWAFIIPIAFGYLLRRLSHTPQTCFRILLLLLTLYLWTYNGIYIASYLLS